MPPVQSAGAELTAEVERLVHTLRERSSGWYAASPGGGPTRAETLRALVRDLAALGAVVGDGRPAGAVPPALGDHALADQVRLLAHEVTVAPDAQPVTARAVARVRAARAALS